MDAVSKDIGLAAAQGDLHAVEKHIQNGGDINMRSKDGMTPLSIAAFWGYTDIVKSLLKHGANVNAQNKGTDWTALHCAAFQGHGPVILRLMEHHPDLLLKDMRGRTAADFASAMDSIWPLFSAMKCRRTPKSALIQMDIVQKVSSSYLDPESSRSIQKSDLAHFSRPGSAYAMRSQMPYQNRDPNIEAAAITGDVLASLHEEPTYSQATRSNPHLKVWDN